MSKTTLNPMGETFGVEPATYNRFQGNPPQGMDADELFEKETGNPPDEHADLQEQIDYQSSQITVLDNRVDVLEGAANTTADFAQQITDELKNLKVDVAKLKMDKAMAAPLDGPDHTTSHPKPTGPPQAKK